MRRIRKLLRGNEKMIKIIPYHHSPKIVWLDTNIINDIADALLGKKQNNPILDLYKTLLGLVNNEKIICPFLKQRDEYIKSDTSEKCDEILLNLGKGKQLKTYKTALSQIERMLNSYIRNENSFCLDKNDIPYYGKNDKDNHNVSHGISVVVLLSGQNKEGIDKDNARLIDYLKRRKEFILANQLPKQKVLADETLARSQIFDNSINQIRADYGCIFIDFEYLGPTYCQIYPLIAYKKILQKDKLEDGDVLYVSEFFKNQNFIIPYDEIYSKIVTEKLFDKSNVKVTDVRDIENLSLILPYASLIITDKAMKGYVEQLKLDKKYDTKIFSLKNYDGIMSELNSIK